MEGGVTFSPSVELLGTDEEKKGASRHISSFFKGCVWYSLWEDFNTPDLTWVSGPLATPRCQHHAQWLPGSGLLTCPIKLG